MIVERWNPEKHLPLVRLWADLHSIKGDVTAAMFPALGIVVGNIAAGFLFMSECGRGMLDDFISDPRASADARDLALRSVIAELVATASEAHVSRLVAATSAPTLAKRALDAGFTVIPGSFLLKEMV